MNLSAIPSTTKLVLAGLGSLLALYAAAFPLVSVLITPQIATGVAAVAVFLTAVFHRSAQIQQVANDVPGLLNGSVTLTQAFTDLKSAIEDNTSATTGNTAATVVAPAPAAGTSSGG